MSHPKELPISGSTHASLAFTLPSLGYKRCTCCKEKHLIKGGHQKNGRFVCAICFTRLQTTRTSSS